jgi:hypothetical protein
MNTEVTLHVREDLRHENSEPIVGSCCVGFINLIGIVAGIRRRNLAAYIGPNRVGSTSRREQNQVSETLCFLIKNRTMNNIQNCGSYINTPSSQTYR